MLPSRLLGIAGELVVQVLIGSDTEERPLPGLVGGVALSARAAAADALIPGVTVARKVPVALPVSRLRESRRSVW